MRNIPGKIIALCLLLVFAVSFVTAQVPPLRVFIAESGKSTTLEVLETQEAKYVLLEEVATLFNAPRKYERFSGRITVTMRGKRIIFTIGQHRLKIDDEELVLSNPPTSISGKVGIPVDFLTEILPGIIGKQITLDQEEWALQISREPFVKKDDKDDVETEPYAPSRSVSTGFRVIIDPGHGGYDVGAKSAAGLLEKNLTLQVARRVKDLLAAKNGIEVYLTRNSDHPMTTAERVNFANNLRGRVFLSLHFNWSPSEGSRGFRVYANSDRMRLGTGAGLEADMFSRARSMVGKTSGAGRFLTQSKRLANDIVSQLRGIQLPGKHDKEAFLASTENIAMPGVLVEILYLSNRKDLTILSSPHFIDSVSQALCNAVVAFKTETTN